VTIVCHVTWRPGEEAHDVHVRVDGINALELSQRLFAKLALKVRQTWSDDQARWHT